MTVDYQSVSGAPILRAKACITGGSHDKSKGDRFMATGGGVLKEIGAELEAEAEIEFAEGGFTRFFGIGASIQEVNRGDSSPCCRQ